jgi:hypothetical protein
VTHKHTCIHTHTHTHSDGHIAASFTGERGKKTKTPARKQDGSHHILTALDSEAASKLMRNDIFDLDMPQVVAGCFIDVIVLAHFPLFSRLSGIFVRDDVKEVHIYALFRDMREAKFAFGGL